jgi:hypothetical protein
LCFAKGYKTKYNTNKFTNFYSLVYAINPYFTFHKHNGNKFFGIGESGGLAYDMDTGSLTYYDEPTKFWFNHSFIYDKVTF